MGYLRKAMFVGLLFNWALLALVGTIWIISEFHRIEFAINDSAAHFVYVEFNAVGGECYIGYQRGGVGLPLPLITGVLAVWPIVDVVTRIRRRKRQRGFDVRTGPAMKPDRE